MQAAKCQLGFLALPLARHTSISNNYAFVHVGEVKFHQASGSRSSLVLRDTAEPTSYWEEERQGKGSEIIFYKNYDTKGYLGTYQSATNKSYI